MAAMGPGQKFLTWVGSVQVTHLWFGFELGKFPQKMSNFSIIFLSDKKNIFGLGQKVPGLRAGLTFCGSKVSSGWVRAHLYFMVITT